MSLFLREEACSSAIVSLYPINEVLWQQRTNYADAVIAEVPTLGACLFLDGEIQSSKEDEDIYHECLVHPVMAAARRRDRVLVIGGGEGATVREVLKWTDVQCVDWVDIDGDVVAACREHLKWGQDGAYTDARVHFHAQDIRDYLQQNLVPYDVIIVDLPDPDPEDDPLDSDVLMNVEFWRLLREAMTTDTVWVTHQGPTKRRGPSGADYFRRTFDLIRLSTDTHTQYHAMIPSFQDDWAFLMSCRPVSPFPFAKIPTRFLTEKAYDYIFRWAW